MINNISPKGSFSASKIMAFVTIGLPNSGCECISKNVTYFLKICTYISKQADKQQGHRKLETNHQNPNNHLVDWLIYFSVSTPPDNR